MSTTAPRVAHYVDAGLWDDHHEIHAVAICGAAFTVRECVDISAANVCPECEKVARQMMRDTTRRNTNHATKAAPNA